MSGPHEVDLLPRDTRMLKRLLQDLDDSPDVLPARNLRDDAAVGSVRLDLRRNHIGEDKSAILDHGTTRLVTGSLNAEYKHEVTSNQ